MGKEDLNIKRNWWESNNPLEIAWGQLNDAILRVPINKYIDSLAVALGRPVYIHEVGESQYKKLIEEFMQKIPKQTLEGILRKLPANKDVLGADSSGKVLNVSALKKNPDGNGATN